MIKTTMFDEYGRKAQLYPALLVILPPLLIAVALFPGLVSLKESLGALVIGCGALYFMANLGREAGRRAQSRLFEDGLPAQRWLRHRDPNLEAPTKRRCKAFLSSKIPGLTFPSATKEATDPAAADALYHSAIRWLVHNTRDNQRIRQELTAYGFRRNLYGLKPWGLGVSLISTAFAAWILWLQHGAAVASASPAAILVLIVAGLVLPAIWVGAVTPGWVRASAECYATALFGFCDLPQIATKDGPVVRDRTRSAG